MIGADQQTRRMLGYWAGTGLFYALCMVMLWVGIENGMADRALGSIVIWCGIASVATGYVLIRAGTAFGVPPWQQATLQSLLAIACNVAAYAATGPVRGASLMVLQVVIVFCAFSLRARQTLALCITAIVALAATIAVMVQHDPVRYPPHVEAIHWSLAAISLLAVTVLTGEMSKLRSRLSRQKAELAVALATIRKLATVDELTSLANRRHMNEVLGAEERRDHSRGRPTCIALLDIDFFKQVNDRHGHAVGDAVLRTFAHAARGELREADMLARWGGEEFLLLLPDTERGEAMQVLGRIAERVAAVGIDELHLDLPVTFSAGVAARQGIEPFAETISRADKAMYLAKSTGRNRIVPG